MSDRPQSPIFYLLLSAAGLIAGAAVCFFAQHLNGKLYAFSDATILRSFSDAARFQETIGHISLYLFALGALISAGSGLILARTFAAKKTASNDELVRVLQDCGIENAGADPLQCLLAAISQLRVAVFEAGKRERELFEKAVDVICVLDSHSKFITVSRACQNAWGFAPEELEGHPLTDLLAVGNSNNVLNSVLGSANSIDKIIFESKLKTKDGRLLDLVWTAHWSAADGRLFCIVHDISERKYAERLLKNSERRLRRTLKSLPVGVLMVDSVGVIEFANAEAARMVSRSTRELVGTSIGLYITPTGRRSTDQVEVLDLSPEFQMKRTMATATRKDGSSFPVELSESIIEVAEEQKTIAVFLDKTAEQELERVKREFIAMVTHEVRTPISSVYGILALIEAGALGEMTEKGRELTRSVKVTCKRVIRLISDLLDFEKIQAGKFALDCKQVSVRYAMEISFDNVVSLAAERKIAIDLPQTELCCWADEDRLVQVLVNLMSNAIKYTPDGSSITLGIEELTNGQLKISVTDKGRGIPEDKLSKVFDQFEQVEFADAKSKGGTGLGLAVCKAIVAKHGGEMGVNSKLGEGSCFWFTMPTNPNRPGSAVSSISGTEAAQLQIVQAEHELDP